MIGLRLLSSVSYSQEFKLYVNLKPIIINQTIELIQKQQHTIIGDRELFLTYFSHLLNQSIQLSKQYHIEITKKSTFRENEKHHVRLID